MTTLVLSAGTDSTRLAIRKLMLTDAGYTVVSALGPEEFARQLFDGDFDVVVLCSSLSPEERRQMTALARQHRPSLRVFALTSDAEIPCDGVASIQGDTKDLVRALATLNHPLRPETHGHAA